MMQMTAGCASSRLARLPRVLAWVALGVLAGCGDKSGEVGKLTVYSVKGSVQLANGKPLPGGRVVFVAKEGLLSFTGPIQDDGTFTLQGTAGDGAPAGEYKVRVEPKTEPLAPGKKAILPFSSEYTDEDASGLTATVKPEPNQLEPFKLVAKSSARPKARAASAD